MSKYSRSPNARGAAVSAKSTYSINSDYKEVPLITSPSQKSGFLKKSAPFSVKALNKSHTMNLTLIDQLQQSNQLLQKSYQEAEDDMKSLLKANQEQYESSKMISSSFGEGQSSIESSGKVMARIWDTIATKIEHGNNT